MTVYTTSTPSASVTWLAPLESVWQMLPAATDCPPGYKRRDLGLSDRLFIGAVVNLPKGQRPWGCLTWLANVFATSRPTVYAIGRRARAGMAAASVIRQAKNAANARGGVRRSGCAAWFGGRKSIAQDTTAGPR
mgnify:CR=1 FL=1